MRWSGLDVDLESLSELVEVFLKKRGFRIRKSCSLNGFEISTLPNAYNELSGVISVEIVGTSNSFEVAFSAKDDGRNMMRLGLLSQLFGGGFLIRKGLNRQEAIEKLEKEFHEYLQQSVAWLSQTSRKGDGDNRQMQT
jgi:hypothetical protein